MEKKQTLREFGLILLNLAAFLVAIYLWALALLLLAIKLSILALGIMIPVGIGLVILLVHLATHTISSRKRWLQSLPIQFLLILITRFIDFSHFGVSYDWDFDVWIDMLLQTLLFAVIAFVIQVLGPLIDRVQSYLDRRR